MSLRPSAPESKRLQGSLAASAQRCQRIGAHPSRHSAPRSAAMGVLLGACLVGLLGCARPAPVPTESIHFSDRLKQIMRRMDTLVHERNMTELEIDRERLRHARTLATAAAELASEADALAPAQTADAALRRAFSRHARALAGAAAQLDALAAAGDYGDLARQMRVVEYHCAACHQHFGVRVP